MDSMKYFAEAEEFANERFSNADAFEEFVDDYSDDMGDYSMANGMNAGKPVKTSQPYIINVANANAVTTPAVILGSYTNRTAANFGNVAGITVTSGLTNITYGELLAQTEHKPFENGIIYIESTNTAQVTQTIALTHQDANGNTATKTIVPKLDPNQQIATVLEWYYSFPVDGFTSLTMNVLATTTVTYSLYPAATVDTVRSLRNTSQVRDYRGPKIGKPVVTTLTASAAKALAQA